MRPWGWITLAIGCVSIYLMYKIIDPKLKAMSAAFAKREQAYQKTVDQTMRWEG